MENYLISRPDAAKSLNISVDTRDRLVIAGHIQRLKIGAKTCFAKSEVERFANELIRNGVVRLA